MALKTNDCSGSWFMKAEDSAVQLQFTEEFSNDKNEEEKLQKDDIHQLSVDFLSF